ncbi:dihydroneopterin aldolase [Lactobacillus sp. LC28-10]|uniref:Dihydroneopterin aldolase n=1 Tax=Secundilactobacillus angelensis TaxID=2722706 RepID=A0ABX1KWR7_9LACO|nr:OsmC family protein [Secundilactobacillus angelensis]MCH5462133.1 OsmC family protein [Secundilactobacillus angelensis]NLR18386.1 dihydroneopterin aldolase [Secundilactobacillus angelensis]
MTEEKHYIHKYETEAINNDGVQGVAYIPNGLAVAVSHPLEDTPGTNPEQLLGLSLSTCMSATLEAIEKENGLPHLASVHVHVSMVKSTDGLDFLVTARIRVPNVTHSQAVDFVHQAERRCPVSKLLRNSGNYTVEVVDNFDD